MSALTKEAVQYGYDPQEIEAPRKKRVINKKKKNKMVLVYVKNTLMIAVAFLLGISLIYNYASITDKKMEISKLSEEITELNNEIDKYNVKLESIKKTDEVEAAAAVLGLNYPSSKQTVFIDFEYEENTEDEAVVAEGEGNRLMAFIDKLIQLIQ